MITVCRYTSIYEVEAVVANYSAAKIPLDTQWVDIDYMQNYRDFTWDSKVFQVSEVSSFVSQLHANGQHFVTIVDPGIMVYDGYNAYDEGMKKDVFIKDLTGSPYLGQVWPGPTYFPDFFHPEAEQYWENQLEAFHTEIPVDGIWIDMNEIANFCNDGSGQVCVNTSPDGCPLPGGTRQTDCCLVCSVKDSSNKYENPPYNIKNCKGICVFSLELFELYVYYTLFR